MVKLSGGSRTLTGGSREYSRREVEFHQLMNSGRYSNGYFSGKGGGYYLVEKSSTSHKPEEIEAARFMADKGYKITLKDEAGDVRTPDGYVFSAGFEQSSPKGDSVNNFKNCLEHARDKPGASAAVVYMRDAGHTKANVKAGIAKYRQHNSKPLRVYVVTKDGRIHRWNTHE